MPRLISIGSDGAWADGVRIGGARSDVDIGAASNRTEQNETKQNIEVTKVNNEG